MPSTTNPSRFILSRLFPVATLHFVYIHTVSYSREYHLAIIDVHKLLARRERCQAQGILLSLVER